MHRALDLQRAEKIPMLVPVQELHLWTIFLTQDALVTQSIRVVGEANSQQYSFEAIFADFDSDIPVFHCRDGKRIKLCGPPHSDFKRIALIDAALIDSSVFLSLVQSAYAAVHTNWCSASLHEFLCLLNTQVLNDAKLSINADNILEARSGVTADKNTPYCHSLLPSYIKLDLNQMRLYTSRGDGTRFVIPAPYTQLTDWCFDALASSSSNLGFCAVGKRVGWDDNEPWHTTEIVGFEPEGVFTTVNGNAYMLEGEPCLRVDTVGYAATFMSKFLKTLKAANAGLNPAQIMSSLVQSWGDHRAESQTLKSLCSHFAPQSQTSGSSARKRRR